MRGLKLWALLAPLVAFVAIFGGSQARAATTYLPAFGCSGWMFANGPSTPVGCQATIPTASLSGTISSGQLATGAAAANLGYTPSHSGANSDITSLSALSTPLSIAQGGTGSTTGDTLITTPGSVTARGIAERFGETLDALDYGIVGDGSTSNSLAALDAALSASTNGGDAVFPCGVYKITATPTITVPSGKRVRLRGGGEDCTELWFSGVNGPTIGFGSVFSSIEIDDMSITTDGTTYAGVLLTQANNKGVNQSLGYGPTHEFYRVLFRGHDFYGAQTEYWNTAFYEKNLSNINFVGGGCFGIASRAGTCYSLLGDASAQSYSVAINFTGVFTGLCAISVSVGDWTQGVNFTSGNSTGCNYGINSPGSGTTGGNSIGQVVGSQFNDYVCGICFTNSAWAGAFIVGNQFIILNNSIGIEAGGTNWVVNDNYFGGAGTLPDNTTGIEVVNGFGNGALLSGNAFTNLNKGVYVPASTAVLVYAKNNQFTNNAATTSSAGDYVIGAGSSGAFITDTQPRNLSVITTIGGGCNTSTRLDTWLQADSNGTVWNATATSGSANVLPIVCNGASLTNH